MKVKITEACPFCRGEGKTYYGKKSEPGLKCVQCQGTGLISKEAEMEILNERKEGRCPICNGFGGKWKEMQQGIQAMVLCDCMKGGS